MKLIVGLGNPGPKYEITRHNAGFLVLDEVAKRFDVGWSGQRFQGELAKGNIHGETCVLLKPMTFMNLSGRSVAQALRFFKIDESDLIVLHDDIDVPSGKVKARTGGGHGGHNGIRSIIAETGLKDFFRIKLGVGRPKEKSDGEFQSRDFGGEFDPRRRTQALAKWDSGDRTRPRNEPSHRYCCSRS